MLSWQVSVLIMAIWIFSVVFRKIQPIFHYWLWSIVVLRLILPFNISMPTGVSQYLRSPMEMKITEITRNNRFSEVINKTTMPFKSSMVQKIEKLDFDKNKPVSLNVNDIVVFTWLGIMLLLGSGTIIWTLHVRKLVKSFPVVSRRDIRELFLRKCRELGIKQNCEIYTMHSTMPMGPTVTGVFYPKILLPYRVIEDWSIKEIEPLVIHELVHIQRHDLIMNWIQIAAQIVYFFHPLVWFANWKIRETREEICDDLTIRSIENKRKRYSQSILNVIEGIVYEPIWGVVDIGFSERKSSLAKRIIRIANKRYKFYKPLDIITTGILIIVSLISISLSCDYSPRKIIGNEVYNEEQSTVIDIALENSNTIAIKIDSSGEYEVDGIRVAPENLEGFLKKLSEESGKKNITIFPDPKSSQVLFINAVNVSQNIVGMKKIKIKKTDFQKE
ncbi:M56 family metallopeptidase [bacterium]|nr:M56 family metallopeptidase [bacterium]